MSEAEKSTIERWIDIIGALPGAKSAAPTEEAPKDGSTHRFRVILDMDAFWCDDLKRWVLVRPLHLECLPTQADHVPQQFKTRRDILSLKELAAETLVQKNRRLRQQKCRHEEVYSSTERGPYGTFTTSFCLDCGKAFSNGEFNGEAK